MEIKRTNNQGDVKAIIATSIAIVVFFVLTWIYTKSNLPEAKGNMLTTLSYVILEIYLGFRFMKSAFKIIVNVPCQDDAEENITPQNANAKVYMRLLILISIGTLDAINLLIHGVEDMVNAAVTDDVYPMNPFTNIYFWIFFVHMLVFSIDALPDIVGMKTPKKSKNI